MISKKKLLNVLKFALFLSIGVVILYLLYRNQNAAYQANCALNGIPTEDCSLLQKLWDDFKSVNYFWIFMIFVVNIISNISRAIRWRMLLQSLGYQPRLINAFMTTFVGYFTNLGLPRMGEVIRAGMMAQYERVAVEKVFGTVAVDRMVDVLSILVVTGLAFIFDFDRIWQFVDGYVNLGEKFGNSSNFLLVLAVIGIIFLALFYLLRKRLLQFAIVQRVVKVAQGFGQGLQSIAKVKRPWLFVLHSVNIWFMYYLMCYLCFWAFAPTAALTPVAALTVYVFGAWGMVVPSPGGMGTYHFLAQLALSFYGINGNDAFSWANISFFLGSMAGNIIGGILSLILLPIVNRHYHPQKVETVEYKLVEEQLKSA